MESCDFDARKIELEEKMKLSIGEKHITVVSYEHLAELIAQIIYQKLDYIFSDVLSKKSS